MSTSFVYHAFGVRTYDYRTTKYEGGAIYIYLEKKPHRRRCTRCRSRNITLEGAGTTTVRTVPIGKKPVFLVLLLHVLLCKDCGSLARESRDIADPFKSYDRCFARLVLELAREMTILAVARYLGISWDLVKSVIKENLERKIKGRSFRKVRYIAIDEIAIRKGHHYMTVVVDLETGQVLFAAEGRDHECLKPFFQRLRRAGAKLKAVAVDMSSAYLKAIAAYGPKDVKVVHDHYHVVSNMNDVVDKVRRDEQKRQEEKEGIKLIKGSRYLLLRGKEKLATMPQKQARLEALLEVNETLHKVYLLKEDLRLFWSQKSKDDAKTFILNWVQEAKSMGNAHVTSFARTIEKRIEGILAWYDYRITTGPLEGLNNKIKVFKRAAYGYRDAKFFGLRILFLHETRFNINAC